jgi:hypothetical protein
MSLGRWCTKRGASDWQRACHFFLAKADALSERCPVQDAKLDVRAGLQQGAEFRTAAGEELAISVLVGEIRVLKHFQKRMPYGLFVP